jgi:hypothetical protein
MNYTVADIVFSTAAFFVFAIFLVPPGYALGWLLDLFNFRQQPPHVRLLLSLPLSVAFTPILVYLIGLYSLSWPIAVLYGLLLLTFLITVRIRGLQISRFTWLAILCWFTVAVLSLVDWQIGSRLYFSVVAYDYTFRSAVTGAFARAHTIPANNPFFFDGHPEPFRYHYFWFMLSAIPVKLTRALFPSIAFSPRHAVIASSVWSGLALFATLALYVRFFLKPGPAARLRITTIAILMIGVSGLDIIPVLSYGIPTLLGHGTSFFAAVDWWNGEQVTTWVGTMLWVPHHLASLIACLTGFLILWNANQDYEGFRWQSSLAAAVAFASATGLSVYVTLAFAVFAFAWTLCLALRREWAAVLSFTAAGLGAALLALPFLAELLRTPSSSGSFLAVGVRTFGPIADLMNLIGVQNDFVWSFTHFLFLPVDYFFELGFFSVIGFAWFMTRRKSLRSLAPHEQAAALMLVLALVFCSFIKSDVAGMNDLGVRGMLLVQFVLVLWAAEFLASASLPSRLLKYTLAIGVATTIYDVSLLRMDTMLSDKGWIPRAEQLYDDPDLGERTASTRNVYESLWRLLPLSAVVQHNPRDYQDIFAGLYSDRQMALMDINTATTFAGDTAGPGAVQKPLEDLFNGKRADPVRVCHDLSIDALIVKDVDPVWSDPNSWVWKKPPVFRAPAAVAVDCRK